jgi:hypothetical protein
VVKCAGMALTYYDFLTIQDMFSFNNPVTKRIQIEVGS